MLSPSLPLYSTVNVYIYMHIYFLLSIFFPFVPGKFGGGRNTCLSFVLFIYYLPTLVPLLDTGMTINPRIAALMALLPHSRNLEDKTGRRSKAEEIGEKVDKFKI